MSFAGGRRPSSHPANPAYRHLTCPAPPCPALPSLIMAVVTKPILAVTMGDPAGIGPEVIVRAWANTRVHDAVRPFVVGYSEVMTRAIKLVGGGVELIPVASPSELGQSECGPRRMAVVNVCSADAVAAPVGVVDARAGEAAYQCVTAAVRWALAKEIGGIVTAPLSKAALHAAGHTSASCGRWNKPASFPILSPALQSVHWSAQPTPVTALTLWRTG